MALRNPKLTMEHYNLQESVAVVAKLDICEIDSYLLGVRLDLAAFIMNSTSLVDNRKHF